MNSTVAEILALLADANDAAEQHRMNLHGQHQGAVNPHDLERDQAQMTFLKAKLREIPSVYLRDLATATALSAPLPRSDTAQAALRWYADEANWEEKVYWTVEGYVREDESDVQLDRGAKARAALEQAEEKVQPGG